MAILGSRTELVQGYQHTRHTGLIQHQGIADGTSQESHRQVLIADHTTQVFGRAIGDNAVDEQKIPMAQNDRRDRTGEPEP